MNFENSSDDNKSDEMEIDFYQAKHNAQNNQGMGSSLEDPPPVDFRNQQQLSNNSSNSKDSNKLLHKFRNAHHEKTYNRTKYDALEEYNQDDHYEKV